MRLRLLARTTALLAVTAVSACGTTVVAHGDAGLSDVAASGAPGTTTPSPTPKSKVTVTVPATPTTGTPTGTPATSTSPSNPTDPIIPVPIGTKLPILTPADCVGYNPATLTYIDEGTTGFVITDGGSDLVLVDNVGDALTALSLLRNYSKQCFIGRDNPYTGNDRYRYIVDYWAGSGLSGATVPMNDCLAYDNTALAINNLGSSGYQLLAGSQAIALTASLADATNVKALAATHQHVCFIGRSNTRANRAAYIVEYWV
jgi:hypothetical protein